MAFFSFAAALLIEAVAAKASACRVAVTLMISCVWAVSLLSPRSASATMPRATASMTAVGMTTLAIIREFSTRLNIS